ncbi:Probable WRKY transcription factor 57 [Striga hermonthica]|uniref:Probable WRKY transcription factor 57 n=1 Tax=Striga hermonthica TaxID=68872 RepID=A0A9N7NAF0_STRHE|nr:Probable WRKY transcription factor 57 [Striga hermonthica]
MSGTENADPVTAPDQSWALGLAADDDDDVAASHGYLLRSDYAESSVLGEFGWAESSDAAGFPSDFQGTNAGDCFSAAWLDPRREDVGGNSFEPMASLAQSRSSGYPVEKQTAPGAAAAIAAARPPPQDSESKTRKKGQKRTRQQSFAFATKSETDNLDDGYRDPSVVITTYEGQHCHYSAGYPRIGGFIAYNITTNNLNLHNPPNEPQENSPRVTTRLEPPNGPQENSPRIMTTLQPPNGPQENFPRSHGVAREGLLGDIVPLGMRKA